MSHLSASFVLPHNSSSESLNLHVSMRRGPSRRKDEVSIASVFSHTIKHGDIREAAYIDRQGHRTCSEVVHNVYHVSRC